MKIREAKFNIGDVVRHRSLPIRGVIFDVDPEFARSEEWYQSLPLEMRPGKDQPFYHIVAENDDSGYVAYVSEASLESDESGEPLRNPQIGEFFTISESGQLSPRYCIAH